MKFTLNGIVKEIQNIENETIQEFQKRISSVPLYAFIKKRRYVSSRQIYFSNGLPNVVLKTKIKTPATFFDLLELELDGDHDVYEALGVNLPPGVPANPLYFQTTTGVSTKENRTMAEYMPFDEVHAFTEDRLPSRIYLPDAESEPRRRPKGYVPSRSNHNLPLVDLARKAKRFGESEYSEGAIRFKGVDFYEDGAMVVHEWNDDVELLIDRMNRLVQFGEACRRTVYDRPTYGRGGVDWVETFEGTRFDRIRVPFRHLDLKLSYQKKRVEVSMSPFLACIAAVLEMSVITLKERLLKRVKRNTFPFYYNGALLRYFGTIQIPAFEDFLNYLKSDDRIDYVFMWEFVSRPGLFPKGVNIMLYDADRQVLIFPTKQLTSLGYQNCAETLSIVKEGDRFYPISSSTPLMARQWYDEPIKVATFDKTARRQVVYDGKVVGAEAKCLIPCSPSDVDPFKDVIEYKDVRMLPPSETVDYLEIMKAKPRYSDVDGLHCRGILTEGMLYVPCLQGEPVLPEPELTAWRGFVELKGVEPKRLERSRQRWLNRRQYERYKCLFDIHGASVRDHVVVVDEFTTDCYYFKNKLVILREFVDKLNNEVMCSI